MAIVSVARGSLLRLLAQSKGLKFFDITGTPPTLAPCLANTRPRMDAHACDHARAARATRLTCHMHRHVHFGRACPRAAGGHTLSPGHVPCVLQGCDTATPSPGPGPSTCAGVPCCRLTHFATPTDLYFADQFVDHLFLHWNNFQSLHTLQLSCATRSRPLEGHPHSRRHHLDHRHSAVHSYSPTAQSSGSIPSDWPFFSALCSSRPPSSGSSSRSPVRLRLVCDSWGQAPQPTARPCVLRCCMLLRC